MLIIFEGNECSGKTTLIDKLLEWRPWFIKCKRTASTWYTNHELPETDPNHDPYPSNWDMNEAFFNDWRFFLEAISFDPEGFNKASFVFDRSFITDWVFKRAIYPEAFTDNYQKMYAAYEAKLNKLPHVIFYCKRQVLDDFKDNFAGSANLTKEDHDKLQYWFDEWRKQTTLNVIDIDNDTFTVNDNINKIIAYVGS